MKKILLFSAIFILLLALLANRVYSRSKFVPLTDSPTQAFRALPYLSASSNIVKDEESGVVKHLRRECSPGYNLYSNKKDAILLVDMDGEIIHRWKTPPKRECFYSILLKNKDLMVLSDGKDLVRLDEDSNIVWKLRIFPHHDIALLEDGSCLLPVNDRTLYYKGRMVVFDSIARISEGGHEIERWSTYDNFEELKKIHTTSNPLEKKRIVRIFHIKKLDDMLNRVIGRILNSNMPKRLKDVLTFCKYYDYYHLNSVQAIPDTPLGRKDKRFREGNWLICLRNVNLIVILDRDSKEIVWSWGLEWLDKPHMPRMLENGNIIVFDNGLCRGYSRVLELDPLTNDIVWEYKAQPYNEFYSPYEGSCQRLNNGNTLICESEKGRAFEVTPGGEIVWEFLNPEVEDNRRRTIYRMIRYKEDYADFD
jgi:hypothetical protein